MEQESKWVNPKYDNGDKVTYMGGGDPCDYINGAVKSLSDVLHGCIYYVIQTEHGLFDVPENHLKPR